MKLFDTRQTFLGVDGLPLSAGRLVFYEKQNPTTLCVAYWDSSYTTPAGARVRLSSAGWTDGAIYVNRSVIVHVQKYMGVNSYGSDVFSDVKTFEFIYDPTSIGASSGVVVVNTIDDLRSLIPVDGGEYLRRGYYALGDSAEVLYTFFGSETSSDNLGTIIDSGSTVPGRFVAKLGPVIPASVFGIIPGVSVSAANYAALSAWCETSGQVAYFESGEYPLSMAGGIVLGCECEFAPFVTFTATTSKYLRIDKPSKIHGTLASTNVALTLNGAGWERYPVLMSAFWNPDDAINGSSVLNLVVDKNATADWSVDTAKVMGDITVLGGYRLTVANNGSALVYAENLRGSGQVSGDGVSFRSASVSQFYTSTAETLSKLVRSYLTIDDGLVLTADWDNEFGPEMHVTSLSQSGSSGSISGAFTARVRGLLSGKEKSVSCTVNSGNSPVPVAVLADSSLIASWNASSVGSMDLLGRDLSASATSVSRSGAISNGKVNAVSASNMNLDRVTINGSYSGSQISATDCIFNGNCGNLTQSILTRCSFNGSFSGNLNAENAVWTEVYAPLRNMRSVGGNSRLINVTVNNAVLIPSVSTNFGNFSWIGGGASAIDFDASQASSDGSFLVYNVAIQRLVGLSGNITSINGASKKWLVEGHNNVRIGEFESQSTKRTYGTCTSTCVRDDGTTGIFSVNNTLIFARGVNGATDVQRNRAKLATKKSGTGAWYIGTQKQNSLAPLVWYPSGTGEVAGWWLSLNTDCDVGDVAQLDFEVYY